MTETRTHRYQPLAAPSVRVAVPAGTTSRNHLAGTNLLTLASCSSMGEVDTLVVYRRAGGMAGVNQRLSIDADGHVELRDREGRCELELDQPSLERVRAALDAIPEKRWSRWPRPLATASIGARHHQMNIGLRRGRRRIVVGAGREDAAVASAIAELDRVLADAVRSRRE
jgi:hypothetical protein